MLTRRDFAKFGGALGLAATGLDAAAQTAPEASQDQTDATTDRGFPQGFRWGTATSAFQIEGAVNEDGRGPSIWDTFCRGPGRIANNANADVANDHFHRYADDVKLMKDLGATTYRFSIAWPRMFPSGAGAPNPKGLDFYHRLVDALLAQGIEPFVTLYHWDLPQALQDNGGWENRDTAQAFADYAGYAARHLTDRVRHIFTMNEIKSFVDLGYGDGVFAPGLKLPPGRLNQLRHNAILGHGLAVQAIRANGHPATQVGLAENMTVCVPVIETHEHITAARQATREFNAPYLTAILEGAYTEAFLAAAGADAPRFTAADMKAIGSPIDFVGINVYAPHHYVRACTAAPGFASVPLSASYPHMASSWLKVGPEALYWAPRQLEKIWNVKTIYITENGCSASDVPAGDGTVYDTDRVMFLRNYLMQLQRATSEGVPVRGYFAWSLMDNFEWADGYGNRFGLHYVDYATQQRTPKLSAVFYQQIIAQNAVV
ncbi:MAG TPA: GH1 family beta-glucosidase [Pseudolabrys sp.]